METGHFGFFKARDKPPIDAVIEKIWKMIATFCVRNCIENKNKLSYFIVVFNVIKKIRL